MAVAVVTEFDVEPGDRSTKNYDAVNARLEAENDPPAGMIVHTAGFDGDIFRILDVWESPEEAQRFYEDRLRPMIEAVMSEAGEPNMEPDRQYSYELHDVIRP